MASALVQHERVVVVGFTGSSAVGAAIARLAPDKELVMELGGNGPVIVLDDADPERTIAAVGAAAFFNAGQSCAAAERIIASERVHDWLVEGLVEVRRGHPRWAIRAIAATTMGPVNNEGVAAKMDDHVADARDRGGTRRVRRPPATSDMPTRLFYEPTVLAGVPDGAAVTREETFGPIAPVSTARDDRALAGGGQREHARAELGGVHARPRPRLLVRRAAPDRPGHGQRHEQLLGAASAVRRVGRQGPPGAGAWAGATSSRR